MGFKEVASLDADTVGALGGTDKKTKKKNPTSIEGYFLGSRKIADRKKKDGVSYIHVFQTPNGNEGVWGKTDLDRKLMAVTPGTMTRVTHTGFRETPNGDMYTYKVEIDPDNAIDVSELAKQAAQTETAASEDDYQDDTEDDSDEDSDTDSENEEDADTSNSLAAARASTDKVERTKALLSRKNK